MVMLAKPWTALLAKLSKALPAAQRSVTAGVATIVPTQPYKRSVTAGIVPTRPCGHSRTPMLNHIPEISGCVTMSRTISGMNNAQSLAEVRSLTVSGPHTLQLASRTFQLASEADDDFRTREIVCQPASCRLNSCNLFISSRCICRTWRP
jgi:hypothetical protein